MGRESNLVRRIENGLVEPYSLFSVTVTLIRECGDAADDR
jgi:hypothetical protein